MKLSFLFFGNQPDEKWALCKQMGIRYAIAKLAPELTNDEAPYHFESLKRSKEIFYENGFELIGLEGDQFDMNNIKLGLPGRDEDIEKYCLMLQNMGALGIKLLCYNFMAGIGWYRTATGVEDRGGALVSAFSAKTASEQPQTIAGTISQAQIWDNYTYFIDKVMPVAERSGVKMALHPDDPPVESLRGIGRIFINAAAVRKALQLSDSSSHGITFCQGTYVTMGENIFKLIDEFGSQNKIFFVHIRDVQGNSQDFRETFHDNGPTDMVAAFNAYKNIGYTGAIRSDHVPTMAGESNEQHGYAMKGNLFGIGYMNGILVSIGIKEQKNEF